MSEVVETLADGERPCFDPECVGIAEPEIDGEHRYFECQECGSTFGYERMDIQARDDACAIGVPESLRRAMSAPMERAMAATAPVKIELGKKPT